MRLIVPILINCFLVLLVYLADKYTPARKLPYIAKQIIIGVNVDQKRICETKVVKILAIMGKIWYNHIK